MDDQEKQRKIMKQVIEQPVLNVSRAANLLQNKQEVERWVWYQRSKTLLWLCFLYHYLVYVYLITYMALDMLPTMQWFYVAL